MKKFLAIIGFAAVALTVSAGEFKSFSFINPYYQSLQCSNAIKGLTNMIYEPSSYTTNYTLIAYTNYAGTLKVTGTNTQADSVNFFQDAPLWDLKGPVLVAPAANAGAVTNSIVGANICVTLKGTSANGVVTFRFAPVLNDKGDAATLAADLITVSVTAVANSTVVQRAPLPSWVVSGCRGIRLKDVSNADEDAGTAVWITDISLNGYVP